MVSVHRTPIRVAAVVLLLALPACTVTFRRQPIQPIDNDRNFEIETQACWDAAAEAISNYADDIESQDFDTANNAGILVTEYSVFPDTGADDWRHLRRVAYAQGASFIGGRYQITLTARGNRGGGCKIRVVARIEGYLGEDFGYQALRSNGVLEQVIFDEISATLGVEPSGNEAPE